MKSAAVINWDNLATRGNSTCELDDLASMKSVLQHGDMLDLAIRTLVLQHRQDTPTVATGDRVSCKMGNSNYHKFCNMDSESGGKETEWHHGWCQQKLKDPSAP